MGRESNLGRKEKEENKVIAEGKILVEVDIPDGRGSLLNVLYNGSVYFVWYIDGELIALENLEKLSGERDEPLRIRL